LKERKRRIPYKAPPEPEAARPRAKPGITAPSFWNREKSRSARQALVLRPSRHSPSSRFSLITLSQGHYWASVTDPTLARHVTHRFPEPRNRKPRCARTRRGFFI